MTDTTTGGFDAYEACFIGVLLWLPPQQARLYIRQVDETHIHTPVLREIYHIITANIAAGMAANPDMVLKTIIASGHTKYWKQQLATGLVDAYTGAPKRHEFITDAITHIRDNAYRRRVINLAATLTDAARNSESPTDLHRYLSTVAQRLGQDVPGIAG